MPIFAYHCPACGHVFDALQKLGAAALTECPECGADQLKKQLSAPAFHLKGKGWRKSDDRPKKPDVRPRFAHTLDSAVPHAEHHDHDGSSRQAREPRQPNPVAGPGHSSGHGHDHGHSHHGHSHGAGHSHGHDHGHSHEIRSAGESKPKGGLGKLVKAHVESSAKVHGHGHEHSSGHSHGPGGHSHGPGGHSHAPKAGLKPPKKHKHD